MRFVPIKGEVWKPIPSLHYGDCEVSDLGRVRRPAGKYSRSGETWFEIKLKEWYGSLYITRQCRGYVNYKLSLGRAMCAAFNGFPEGSNVVVVEEVLNRVRYINRNLKNPYVPNNLEWDIGYMVRRPIEIVNKDNGLVQRFESVTEACEKLCIPVNVFYAYFDAKKGLGEMGSLVVSTSIPSVNYVGDSRVGTVWRPYPRRFLVEAITA